jgi:SAM-dependent methyltransferase
MTVRPYSVHGGAEMFVIIAVMLLYGNVLINQKEGMYVANAVQKCSLPTSSLNPFNAFRKINEWNTIFPYWKDKEIGFQKMFDVIMTEVPTVKDKTFLDVGCSYGYMDFTLTDLGAWTSGLEVVQDKVAIARNLADKYQYCWYNPLFCLQNALDYPYYERIDYVLFFNLMHHIGLFHSDETAWKLLKTMVHYAKKVFLMVRVHWERPNKLWHIADNFEEAAPIILEKSGADWLHDYGVVHRWQGRSICVLGKE